MTSKICALVFLSALCRGHADACTPADACPKLTDGLYCPVNDVTEHGDINRDLRHIAAFLNEAPPNYVGAKQVYTQGRESSEGGGKLRTLQSMARTDMTEGGKYNNSFYSGAVDLYGSADAVWHDLVMACLENTGPCKDKGDAYRTRVISQGARGIITAYATYEMGAAIWQAATNLTDTNLTDSAAYAWDRAAAFYVGNAEPFRGDGVTGRWPGNLYSPYDFSWKRDLDFPQGANTHAAAIPILNYGLKAARSADVAKMREAEAAMHRVFAVAAIRGAIRSSRAMHRVLAIAAIRGASWSSWKAYESIGGLGGDWYVRFLADASMSWRLASGFLSTLNKTLVQEVDALLSTPQASMDASVPCRVKALVEQLYEPLGISCDVVGPWKDGMGCMAGTCSSRGRQLLAGDSSYLDNCKSATTAAPLVRSQRIAKGCPFAGCPVDTTTTTTAAALPSWWWVAEKTARGDDISGAAAVGLVLACLSALVHMA